MGHTVIVVFFNCVTLLITDEDIASLNEDVLG